MSDAPYAAGLQITTESGASIERMASVIYAIRVFIAADATDFKELMHLSKNL
jgi:hypothetical protein